MHKIMHLPKAIAMIVCLPAVVPLCQAGEIHNAVSAGNVQKVQRLLRAHPKLIHARDENKMTPLLSAVRRRTGPLPMVKLLMRHGADVHARNNQGWTAYHIAMRKGHRDAVRYLVSRGADPKAQTYRGQSLLNIAISGMMADEVRRIIADGADVNAFDQAGTIPLATAAFSHPAIAELLIEKGARIDGRGKDGRTPLMKAVSQDRVDTAKVFLSHGADPNLKYPQGITPLHMASYNGNIAMAKLLLSKGADPNLKDSHGLTPLHIAEDEVNVALIRLLRSHGAVPTSRQWLR